MDVVQGVYRQTVLKGRGHAPLVHRGGVEEENAARKMP